MSIPIHTHTGKFKTGIISKSLTIFVPYFCSCFHTLLSMVLTLCARSNEYDAAVRASNILDSMEGLYSQGHTNVIANSRCYSAVITAWARSGSPDNVKHAFDLIDRMEQNKRNNSPHGTPNSHCYNACIHAIAKSSNPEKVKHCLDILQRMIDAKNAGDIDSAPTIVTYSTIVNGKWRIFVFIVICYRYSNFHNKICFNSMCIYQWKQR